MVRFATFNASLNRNYEGELIAELTTSDNAQAQTVTEIIQRVNPDVLLINEFDFDSEDEAVELFKNNYLNVGQNGVNPVDYPYFYVAPSNTGIASGFDLDNNGEVVTTPGEPGYGNDAFGFGNFPGQFGMAVYSKYPIDFDNIRTFQNFLWRDMPGALLPIDTDTGESFYSEEELDVFRLSSKSHWDLPLIIDGETVHFLVSHPTPPVFDGPEDKNGNRNHDEIRFWADYITPGNSAYIYDDQGNFGGLKAGTKFVIAGDQNADPFDGDSVNSAINQLLDNPQINTVMNPSSDGGVDASLRQGNINESHQGNPAFDTADFNDNSPGNLRVDYVLPSENLEVTNSGVFWPTADDSLFNLVGDFPFPSSDHRLVYTDINVEDSMIDSTRKTVTDLNFIGEVIFDTGFTFEGTEFGGISGLTYDPNNDIYYGLSDDRSQRNDARFYNLDIDLSDGILDENDINIVSFTTLLDESGTPFTENVVDPEGIALTSRNTLFISSEGNANNLVAPFVNEFSLSGEQFNTLPVPNKFSPTADQSSGIRNNQAFESLTITPDERYLYTAVENALWQDGTNSTLEDESAVRILQYDLETGTPGREFLYFTDPIPNDSNPPGGFADNGLVELLALDNTGTFLSLERSFASGVGNNIRLYEVRLQGATDISQFDSLAIDTNNPNNGLFDVDEVAEKRLLIDFDELGVRLDNSEALAFGPTLPNGLQSLIVASDNNFNDAQISQFLAFELDINSIPFVTPTSETTSEIRFDDPNDPNVVEGPDSDDPAIYVHPTDVEQSLVITTLKNGGLTVYDLEGQEVQRITPDNIRYNNVDLVYGFNLDGNIIDIAVVSDRLNDTLVIFEIDPATQQLTDITSTNILETIFGVDDGEATAYGVATYTSPVTGKVYTFVSQRDGDQIAQLELVSDGEGNINTEIVRTFSVPIPPGGETEDAQVEGMVVDRELGYLYVGQEEFGIWRFLAEPDSSNTGTIVDTVNDINPNSNLIADVEGLTIYYGEDGTGYLLASSQGDSSFAVYDRGGSNSYLGSFVIGENDGIDAVEETDGIDIINVPLGDKFPKGLLVVHDGSNEEATVFQDPEDGEIQNFNTNFKYIDLENLSNTLPFFELDTESYDPRNPNPDSLINGVASGDTTQDSTVLWARSLFTGDITFEYSTDPNFSSIVGAQTLTVSDPNLPVKVEITELNPNTRYYYSATDAAGDTAIGTFKTSAPLGTNAGLSFGVSGDWRGELAPYPAISNAVDMELDFFVEHGDTIYADIGSDAVKNPDGTRKEQVETIEEYRAKHSEVYDSRLGLNVWEQLRANTSILATIDDHEVTNDFAGGATADTDDRFSETEGLINDTQLYENGLQAFQEYNPLRDEFYGDVGDERFNGERQLYRHENYGSDAAVFVLDTRSFRDTALPGPENFLDLGDRLEVLNASLTEDRTLLGSVQLADLKEDLLAADNNGVTWKFVMVPEPIQNIFPGINTDAFEGYSQERTEILKFIDENEINNVVFVAADIHTTFVNNLTYQEEPNGEQIATNVFEITTGAVAFDAPTGELLANIFTAGDEELQGFYDSLPIAPDMDDEIDDRDDFVKQIINDTLLTPLGFDPLGLNNNLPQAEGLIDATLLQGDYFAGHTYGWTRFDIDPETQQLKVITYGIEAYSEEELLSDPQRIISLTPIVVSEFIVNPTINVPENVFATSGNDVFDSEDPRDTEFIGDEQNLFTGSGDDYVDVTFAPGGNRIDLGSGNDFLFAGTNNRIIAGSGNDTLFFGSAGGDNVITGGSGEDQFWIVTDSVDFPTETNTITDFTIGEDVIGLATTDLGFADLELIEDGSNTIIHAFERDLVILRRIESTDLSISDFVFSNSSQSQNFDNESVEALLPVVETVSEEVSSNNINSLEELPSDINEVISLLQSDNEGEFFDLRNFANEVVSVDFVVTRSANYNNYVGFYEIDDITGTINGLNPGDAGYTEAALSRQVSNIGLHTKSGETLTVSSNLNGGSLYAPFIVVNNTPDSLIDLSSVYFPFLGANGDSQDRVRLLGDNRFGFEDATDFDYNDLIVEAEFSLATV
ncbi:MAG: phytase [Crocosphaera sp.]|nr:phytase [Crocosphaera sp.]